MFDHARSLLKKDPVFFDARQMDILENAIRSAAEEFSYQLVDLSIESWHLHWVFGHGIDSVPTMVGRLKNRMRQALNCGRVWTEGYCHRCLYSLHDVAAARLYVARHAGCRLTDGRGVGD